MSFQLEGYKVFIASPGGLEKERRGFKKTIDDYNADEAVPRDVMFQAVGWEETLGGMGRPQSLINEELRQCDYFLMVLHDRWGSHPGENESGATSGTEEEYQVALDCLTNEFPLRQIIVLFKAVPENQMSDPGKELSKVLDFRKKLEQEKTLLFSTFSSTGEFIRLVRKHLGNWLRNPTEVKEEQPKQGLMFAEEPFDSENISQELSGALKKAWKLANEGRLVEAEVEFSRVVVNEPGSINWLSYAKFLRRVGRLDQAIVMIEKAIDSAEYSEDQQDLSSGLTQKGIVLATRGDLDGANAMYKRSLEIEEKLGRLEGMAIQYGNLGIVLQTRGDLDGAEAMYKQALELNEKLGRLKGMASQYGNLGIVLKTRGDLDGAEAMYQQALKLLEKLDQLDGMAIQYGNLGNVLKARGDLDGAETMYKQALELNEKLGRLKGMAIQYGNLGILLRARGDLDGAETMYKRALELNEKLGRLEGMAILYGNLGNVLKARGDLDGAETMYNQALELNEKLGRLEGVAIQYRSLGNVLEARGDLDGAEAMYKKCLGIAGKARFNPIAEKAEQLLKGLEKRRRAN